MTRSDILEWVRTDFLPLQLSIPDQTVLQQVENVIRYFNTNSAVKVTRMYPTARTIEVDEDIKSVIQVLPSKVAASSSLLDPNWVLLGIQSMNYLSADIIMINEAYKNYAAYFGTDFQWHFERGVNPSQKGKLYCSNVPSGANKLCIVGALRILDDTETTEYDINHDHILDFVLRATKALVKICEGNVLRKADMINIKNDGQALLNEGTEDWKLIKEELFNNSRWFAMGQRM
jgi:hypothetical protein